MPNLTTCIHKQDIGQLPISFGLIEGLQRRLRVHSDLRQASRLLSPHWRTRSADGCPVLHNKPPYAAISRFGADDCLRNAALSCLVAALRKRVTTPASRTRQVPATVFGASTAPSRADAQSLILRNICSTSSNLRDIRGMPTMPHHRTAASEHSTCLQVASMLWKNPVHVMQIS